VCDDFLFLSVSVIVFLVDTCVIVLFFGFIGFYVFCYWCFLSQLIFPVHDSRYGVSVKFLGITFAATPLLKRVFCGVHLPVCLFVHNLGL